MMKKLLILFFLLISLLNASDNDCLGYWRSSGSAGLSIIGSMIISEEQIEWGSFNDTPYNERNKIRKKYPCKAKYTLVVHEKNNYKFVFNTMNCTYKTMAAKDTYPKFKNFNIKIMNESEAIISSYNDEENLVFESRIYRSDKNGRYINLQVSKKEID